MIWSAELDAGNFQRKVRSNAPFREAGAAELDGASELRSRETPSGAMPSHALAEGRFEDTGEPLPAAEPGRGAVLLGVAATDAGVVRHSSDCVAAPPFDSVEEPAHPRLLDERAGSRRRRGGRPASLWAAEDPSAMLNLPIARPVPAGGAQG